MRSIKLAAIVHLLWSVSALATLSNVYNTATPAGGDDPRLADDNMRLIKAAIQERMNDHNGTADEGDHYWPLVSSTLVSNNDTGQHRMVTLRQMTDNPSTLTSYASIANLGFLYQKDVSGNGELYWQDEAANVLQITTAGLLNLNSAIWDGVFATSTSDAGDSKSISLTSGGAYGVGRGAGIILYGNEHATNPGQLVLEAGYSDSPTNSVKAVIDVKGSKISNVADPAAAQDAVTKAFLQATVGSAGVTVPVNFTTEKSITFPNGFIFKFGEATVDNTPVTVTFADTSAAFPTGCVSAWCQETSAVPQEAVAVTGKSSTTLTLDRDGGAASQTVYWFAIGY